MKIAIVGSIHQSGLNILKENNFDIVEIVNFEINSLKKELEEVDGIVLRTAQLKENELSKCKNLKIISRHGVGYDNVDIEYLNKNKIALGITSTSNAVSVAEHVMTMFLYLSKKINVSDKLTKDGNFEKKAELPEFFEIYKKNVFILGFGRIGQALAKRCLGFESNVYVYDPYIDEKIIKEKNCYPINFNEGIKIADYISFHLPLNKQTKNLFSYDEFKKCKNNLIIVNTSRGGIVNEKALYESLREKKILGAGLDVFETEPPEKNHLLYSLENILLTPHNSALTLECRKRMSIETCQNIIYYLTKDKKINKNNLVNREYLDLD
tara:strand:+ start:2503 stop:3474 length:972 start_codon:yes stop_codon:yes gene_type:complete